MKHRQSTDKIGIGKPVCIPCFCLLLYKLYNAYDLVFNKGTSGDNRNYWLGTVDDKITFGFYDGGTRKFETDQNLQTDTWYHIAATFHNDNDEVRLYLDGSPAGTWSTSAEPLLNTEGLHIGTSQFDEDWDGKLDDLRIYDRVLSPDEISQLHALAESGCDGG